MSQVIIESRFNGPPDSGNGGYVCGVVARAVEGPSIVTLRKPPPLERLLSLTTVEEGDVKLVDGETIIAEARSEPLELDIPPAPSFDEAIEASKAFPAREVHAFPTCFVCGPGRPDNDGMNIFPGQFGNDGRVASPWMPDASMPNDNKRIRDEIVWAALDCTSYFPHAGALAVLGRLQGKLLQGTQVGERYIVMGWNLGGEGRKLWSGSAVFDEDGNPCAIAKATWIALKTEQDDFNVAG